MYDTISTWALPDLVIRLNGQPITFAQWGYDDHSKCNMDRMGVVGSALARFSMGLGERPPLQPFPVLLERFV